MAQVRRTAAAGIAAALAGAGCCCTGCQTGDWGAQGIGSRAPRPAAVNHIVFFKLNDSGDSEELIADCDASLARIEGIVSYYCGRHLDIGRSNVVADYDVGFYVGFDTKEAYEAYLADEAHVRAVEKWRPRTQWMRVYDVLDPTP